MNRQYEEEYTEDYDNTEDIEYEDDNTDEEEYDSTSNKKRILIILIPIIIILVILAITLFKTKATEAPVTNNITGGIGSSVTQEEIEEEIKQDISNRAEELAEVTDEFTKEEIVDILSTETTAEQQEVHEQIQAEVEVADIAEDSAVEFNENTNRLYYEDTEGNVQSVPKHDYSDMTAEQKQAEYEALTSALTDGSLIVETEVTPDTTDFNTTELDNSELSTPNDLVITPPIYETTETENEETDSTQPETSSTILDSITSGEYREEITENVTNDEGLTYEEFRAGQGGMLNINQGGTSNDSSKITHLQGSGS